MGLASSRESGRSGDILMVQLPFIDTYREFRDYVQWLKGNYVPTEAKLRSMVESGFVFPETCKAILKPMEVNILKPVVKLEGIQFLMMSIPSAGLSPVPFSTKIQTFLHFSKAKLSGGSEIRVLQSHLIIGCKRFCTHLALLFNQYFHDPLIDISQDRNPHFLVNFCQSFHQFVKFW